MKKIISVLIILALSFSMFSCKKKVDTDDEAANTVQDEIPATETEKVTETEKEAEDTDKTENKPSQSVNSETKTPEPQKDDTHNKTEQEQPSKQPVETPEQSLLEDIEFENSKTADIRYMNDYIYGHDIKSPTTLLINSESELEAFKKEYSELLGDNYKNEHNFTNVTQNYNDTFFKEKSLMLIFYSCSYENSHKTSPVRVQNGSFEIDIYDTYSNVSDCEVRFGIYVIPFDKSLNIKNDSRININYYNYYEDSNEKSLLCKFEVINTKYEPMTVAQLKESADLICVAKCNEYYSNLAKLNNEISVEKPEKVYSYYPFETTGENPIKFTVRTIGGKPINELEVVNPMNPDIKSGLYLLFLKKNPTEPDGTETYSLIQDGLHFFSVDKDGKLNTDNQEYIDIYNSVKSAY